VDSSAFVKLPLRELEHASLRAELGRWEGYVSSALIGVEAIRACSRYGPEYAQAARAGLDALALLPVDDEVLDHASRLQPWTLRSLDAIHLATALIVRDDLGVVVSYDERFCVAARAVELPVATPR
jgi:predicted nucleic acid-binding protein